RQDAFVFGDAVPDLHRGVAEARAAPLLAAMLDLAALGDDDQGIAAAVAALADALVLHAVRPEAVGQGGIVARELEEDAVDAVLYVSRQSQLVAVGIAERRRLTQSLAGDLQADDARRRQHRQGIARVVHLQDRAVHVVAMLLHAAAQLADMVV